ncbi:hypothetical protein KM043_002243 [Ampulex compressa]|nr:hypothetical protein KM043_002243 [Ampulex compressa]
MVESARVETLAEVGLAPGKPVRYRRRVKAIELEDSGRVATCILISTSGYQADRRAEEATRTASPLADYECLDETRGCYNREA